MSSVVALLEISTFSSVYSFLLIGLFIQSISPSFLKCTHKYEMFHLIDILTIRYYISGSLMLLLVILHDVLKNVNFIAAYAFGILACIAMSVNIVFIYRERRKGWILNNPLKIIVDVFLFNKIFALHLLICCKTFSETGILLTRYSNVQSIAPYVTLSLILCYIIYLFSAMRLELKIILLPYIYIFQPLINAFIVLTTEKQCQNQAGIYSYLSVLCLVTVVMLIIRLMQLYSNVKHVSIYSVITSAIKTKKEATAKYSSRNKEVTFIPKPKKSDSQTFNLLDVESMF